VGSGNTPFSGQPFQLTFTIEGRPTADAEMPSARIGSATPEFFRTIRTPLIAGRVFTDADNETGAPVVLVDQTAVDRYWRGEDPIGGRLRAENPFSQQPWATIVGVVGRTKTDGLDAPDTPHIYYPSLQRIGHDMNVYVRTAASPESLAEGIRRQVQSVDADLPVSGVRSMESVVSDSLASRRFAMQVLGLFAGTALLLATIGIYGVMGYFVSQRVQEIGIRIALGARGGDVARLVLGRGLILTAVGIAGGTVGAAALVRSLTSLVFGIAPLDPFTFLSGAALLVLVALAACYLPARRAMRVDPMVALRYP
jgi:putative ABC transport system permease protein